MSCACKNEYTPLPAVVEAVRDETFDTKTFRVSFKDKALARSFTYLTGQFMELSLPGVGEAPISITSSPSRKGYMEFTIRRVGKVTNAIHELKVGDTVFMRGPYGNSFPVDSLKGKDIYFIVGGIGLAPIRSLINLVFDNRKDFGKVKIMYGARTPGDLCFKNELGATVCFLDEAHEKVSDAGYIQSEVDEWREMPDTEIHITVDTPSDDWKDNVGVVTTLWEKTEVKPHNAVAVVCGPPIMIKFVIKKLAESGFKDKDIVMTLERYMKCGIGKCGHCNVGGKFICVDGPVFTYEQVRAFPPREHAFD